MSQLNGFFALRTPEDLLGKLEADFERLRAADPASIEAQYAAFDFFVTAEHLPDWLYNTQGGSKAQHRAYLDGALVSHVANGAKHFRVKVQRHTTVKETRSQPAPFQPNAFQATAFDVVPRLVLDLENGTSMVVDTVAKRVVDHWRSMLRP